MQEFSFPRRFIERDMFEVLKNDLERKEITALLGSRRVGKTTVLKKLYSTINKKKIYLSFDDIEVLDIFENDIKTFARTYVEPYEVIFIDEIQYAKNSGKNLKYLFDTYSRKMYISGSSVPDLSIKTLSHLVGRVFIRELYPLSFKEFLRFKDKEKYKLFENFEPEFFKYFKNYLEEYLLYGGYPSVVTENDINEKILILKNIINTYLLREIKEVLGFQDILEFENAMKILSANSSRILKYNSLSNDSGITSYNLKKIVSVLEKTYLIYLLRPFYPNKYKELIKSPKIYFIDSGIRNYLIKNFSELEYRQDKGALYEMFVLNQFLNKQNIYSDLKYWNFKSQKEVNFVIEKNGKIYGIEVKSKLRNLNIKSNITTFVSMYKNVGKIYVINENVTGKQKVNGVSVEFVNILDLDKYLGF